MIKLTRCSNVRHEFDMASLPLSDGLVRIYALMNGSSVVYVGKTINVRTRVSSHKHDKEFTSVVHGECGAGDVSDIEASNIVKLNPPLNKSIPANRCYNNRVSASGQIMDAVFGIVAFESGNAHFADYYSQDDISEIALAIKSHIQEKRLSNETSK